MTIEELVDEAMCICDQSDDIQFQHDEARRRFYNLFHSLKDRGILIISNREEVK